MSIKAYVLSALMLMPSCTQNQLEAAELLKGLIFVADVNVVFVECGGPDPLEYWELDGPEEVLWEIATILEEHGLREGEKLYVVGNGKLVPMNGHIDISGEPTGLNGRAYLERLSESSSDDEDVEKCLSSEVNELKP